MAADLMCNRLALFVWCLMTTRNKYLYCRVCYKFKKSIILGFYIYYWQAVFCKVKKVKIRDSEAKSYSCVLKELVIIDLNIINNSITQLKI
ncbi:hypothetical protein MXB_3677 [Myxobolus squamalis]|nr:hypothetical protein MXB_3677 [Myxobolus squamalis]